MNVQDTTAKGHLPTLIASFLHFDLSFMLWVLLGSLGIYIADSAGLTPSETGLMVAVPILSGSLLRIPLGLLSDRIGGKWTGVGLLAFLFIPLSLGWQFGNNLPTLLSIGLLLGTAGASFAVALPLASRWYPPDRQGLSWASPPRATAALYRPIFLRLHWLAWWVGTMFWVWRWFRWP